MRFVTSLATWVAALAGGLAVAIAADRPTALDGFRELCQVTSPEPGPAHPERFPEELVRDRSEWSAEKTAAWRADLFTRYSAATPKAAREGQAGAWVRIVLGASEAEVALRWDVRCWVLAAAQEYVVAGPAFDRANQGKPVRGSLARYTDQSDGNFAKAAYSFGYAGASMAASKNRADVWLDKQGRLSLNHGAAMVVGKGDLAKASVIPTQGAWSTLIDDLAKGQVIVVHCRRSNTYDFYARMIVLEVKPKGVTFEWNLLSLGEGAPADIHTPSKAPENDGADGLPGLSE